MFGFPLATEYNKTVAVDFHDLVEGEIWYLHIIEEFTRFSAGYIMRSKKSSKFANTFLEVQIAVHGAAKRLCTDNEGEFNTKEVGDITENFNIEVKTTVAYRPWRYGLLKRHNEALAEIWVN